MRDYLLLYINGKRVRVAAKDAFMPLSSFLRYETGATGTKVVCEEGDCGACSVVLGKVHAGEISYRVVNSCIQFLYQLDCTHVVTIEGLKVEGQLNPVQEAMVECHGAQCGYCTPGFVVAMCAMFEKKEPVCEQQIKDHLTGNLCRCTGYEPIIKAGLNVRTSEITTLHELYPQSEMLRDFHEHATLPVLIESDERKFYNPVELADAVRFKADNPGTVVVSGGTDVCVFWNKRGLEPARLMSVSKLQGLNDMQEADGQLVVGAKVTLSQLEDFVRDRIPQLARMMWLFGSPQIRNAGTLAGNIGNGSPIADSLPFLFVMEAKIELTGCEGVRLVNINNFYKGYRQNDLAVDELITRIHIPLPGPRDILRLYKVSRRRHLDISAFTAAFRLQLAGNTIADISIAYGGVAATVIRLKKTEAFLKGKPFTLAMMTDAAVVARSEFNPLSDVRGSGEFRNTLADNILQKLYYETECDRELACRR